MKTTNEQRREWAANALALAAELPDSAERDTLRQIAKEHLRAIDLKEWRKANIRRRPVATQRTKPLTRAARSSAPAGC